MMNKLPFVLMITTSLCLSGCGINMKPDPQQAYDSFKERRTPRDNYIAASGELDVTAPYKNNFTPYAGRVSGQAPNHQSSNASVKDAITATISGATSSKDTTTSSGSSTTKEPASIVDRLKQKFSSNNIVDRPSTPIALASNRMIPIENTPHVQIASVGQTVYSEVGQGDTNNVESYYDLADEISPLSAAYTINHAKLSTYIGEETMQLAKLEKARNASSPLVDVEDAPSYDELKESANYDSKPELRDIPKAQQKRVVEDKDKDRDRHIPNNRTPRRPSAPHHSTSDTEAQKSPAESIMAEQQDIGDIQIQDTTAKIIYKDGKAVLTGVLGKLKK